MTAPDGSPVEFRIENVGEEAPLPDGSKLILTPSGRGVETETHKLIALDSGETMLYDSVNDPDGMTNIASDPANAVQVETMTAKLANFPATLASTTSEPIEAIPVESIDAALPIPKVTAPAPTTPDSPDLEAPELSDSAETLPSPVLPAKDEATKAKPPLEMPSPSVGGLPKSIPEKIKLPEPGLPKGLESEEDLPATPAVPKPLTPPVPPVPKPDTASGPPPVPSKPSIPPVPKPDTASGPTPAPKPDAAKIELPKPGLPKPGGVSKPDLPKVAGGAPKTPASPKPDTPSVPKLEKVTGEKAEGKPDKSLYETDTDIQAEDPEEAKQGKKDNAEEKGKSDLQKDLLKEFDADGDGQIREDEKPSDEQLKQFTKRHREKPQIDQVDSKRKSRIEAETAVKNAMRELEEARVHEELSAREELEAHKLTLDKAKKELARNDEEMEKIEQADRSKHEKNEATLGKLKQEHEHAEDLIRHTIRAKKAAHLDDEDRIHELDVELHRLHEEETERIRRKEEEDQRREEEDRAAHERYLERVRADEGEISVRKGEMEKLKGEEQSLKEEIGGKEKAFQEKARQIKFDDDDEHSRHEHELDVLQKSREKLEAQVNIEIEEIKNLDAKLDARRITQADERKSERRQAVAEHEAELMKESLDSEETVKLAKPVIDRDQPPTPDLEPSLPKSEKVEPIQSKPALPVGQDLPKPTQDKEDTKGKSTLPKLPKSDTGAAGSEKPALPELPKPIGTEAKEDKPVLPALPKPDTGEVKSKKPALSELPKPIGTEAKEDKPVLPALSKPDTGEAKSEKSALPVLPKPTESTEDKIEKPASPSLPQPPTEIGDSTKLTPLPLPSGGPPPLDESAPPPVDKPKKKGIFGKIFGKKKKEDRLPDPPGSPDSVADSPKSDLSALPETPEPGGDLPPAPLPVAKSDLPPPPDEVESSEGEELERKMIERKLQKIADDRAERNKGGADESPVLPPLPKAGGSKPALPALPKPGGDSPKPPLPSLPKPTGEKSALPSLSAPTSGGEPKPALSPLPKPESGSPPNLPPLPKPESGSPPNLPPLPKPGGLPPLSGSASVEDEADQQTRDQERGV